MRYVVMLNEKRDASDLTRSETHAIRMQEMQAFAEILQEEDSRIDVLDVMVVAINVDIPDDLNVADLEEKYSCTFFPDVIIGGHEGK